MNNLNSHQKLIAKLAGYYVIPHELLHVLAYRLLGKSYRYRWGQPYVEPVEQMTRRERLFTSLFPFTVCFGLGWLLSLGWITLVFFLNLQTDHPEIPVWLMGMLLVSIMLVFYSSMSQNDLIKSYHLLFPKDKPQDHSPKPHRSPDDQHQDRQEP